MASNQKLLRWFDLLAALLRMRYPVSFTSLARDVPAYAAGQAEPEAIMRMFERDKDELRRAGIAIDTVLSSDGDSSEYQLRTESFYLPYLVLADEEQRAAISARRVPPAGYRTIPTLSLLPEEAVMLRRAAERVRLLGEPQLTHDASQALRKLRHDLPDEFPVDPPPAADPTGFAVLLDAIQRRKSVSFSYFSIGRGETADRTVHPYGLVFVTGHWYLVAREPAVDGLRRFRTSRVQRVRVNTKHPATPDFTTPPDFDLKVHAKSRPSWELGDGDTEEVDVRFVNRGGDVTAAARHGEQILMDASRERTRDTIDPDVIVLRFRVRRRDTFLRWLLAFAGTAVPVSPQAVVNDWRQLVHDASVAHRTTGGDA